MANDPSSLTVTSSLFSEGDTIPMSAAHPMAGGQNISPDLVWTPVPAGAASIAVTCYDPDAPTTVGFTHWILFDLNPGTQGLAAGAGSPGKNPPGSVLGMSDWGSSEYGGMAPPPGETHHYQFTVWVLDTMLGGGPTTTFAMVNFMMRGHVLARGQLTGVFGM